MHMSGEHKTYETRLDHEKCWNYSISWFLMAENINVYFSSMLTIEDISVLPVPDTNFQDAKSE